MLLYGCKAITFVLFPLLTGSRKLIKIVQNATESFELKLMNGGMKSMPNELQRKSINLRPSSLDALVEYAVRNLNTQILATIE